MLSIGLLCPGELTANISGSVHDFSATGWSGGEICKPCHTPHNAGAAEAPLWNHEISQADYTLYTSPTMNGSYPTQQPNKSPGGMSRLCLSCHDGTIALDSFGGAMGSTMISGTANLGTNLGDDHPVGMQWGHQTAMPACGNCHDAHGDPTQILGPAKFFNGRIECPTCHDVHDKESVPKLLVVSNVGSQLCLHCHGK